MTQLNENTLVMKVRKQNRSTKYLIEYDTSLSNVDYNAKYILTIIFVLILIYSQGIGVGS